ncbi:MAG: cation:proton antiporter [Allobaculum sp.]
MEFALSIGTALLAGLLLTRLGNKFRLPDVTSYLIAGLILGPCCLGMLGIPGFGFNSFEEVEALSPFNDVALGFIAFAIGSEFRISHLRKTGHAAVIIGIFQAVITTIIVDLVLFGVHLVFPDTIKLADVLILGAIAAATAPAATLMVVRQYKAEGEVTSTLLPVVALDDAVGLMLFALSYGIATNLGSDAASDMGVLFGSPLLEIVCSLLIGAIIGWILTHVARIFHSNRNRISLIVGFIILGVTISSMHFNLFGIDFGLSSLLVNMMLGTVFCNCCKHSADLMDRADRWSAPLLTLFFVLSGAELDLFQFGNLEVLLIGVIYITARCAGKYFGAAISSKAAHSPALVQKWLGITLFPQAGVALGMAATVGARMGAEGALIRNIVLLGVMVYELTGPSLTKFALTKAGEIKPKA